MATIRRVPVAWTTGVGGAGVSVFYSAAADDATASLGTFFNAIKSSFPTAVTWTIPSSGDTLEATTGTLTGSWSGGTSATYAGTAATSYVAGTGAYVRWYTNTIRAGRKFVGRTYLLPLINAAFDASGTIDNGTLGAMQSATNTLVGTGLLVVWGRPLSPGGSDGIAPAVTGGEVPDKVTSLKTRRS